MTKAVYKWIRRCFPFECTLLTSNATGEKNSTPLNVPRHITAVIEIIQHFYSSVIALMVIAGHET